MLHFYLVYTILDFDSNDESKIKKVFYKMKKRTVCLFVLISAFLSACAFLMNWPTQQQKPTTVIPDSDTMSEMDELFYEIVKDRSLRDIPETADFSSYLVATMAKRESDFLSAGDYYAKASQQDPNYADLYNQTYLMYVLAGEIDKSVPYAQKVLEVNENNILSRLVLFSYAVKNKKFDKAQNFLNMQGSNEGLDLYKVSLLPLLQSWIYVGQGEKEKALKSLYPLSQKGVLESLYYLHVGLIADYFNDVQKAEQAYDELAKMETPSLHGLMVMYDFYKRKQLLEKRPSFMQAYLKEKASNFISRDLMMNPSEMYQAKDVKHGMSMAFFDMASLVSQSDNYEVSLYLIRLASDLDPSASINQLFLGEILEAMGQYKEANKVYRSLTKKSDLYLSMQLRLASSLIKMEQSKEAKDVLLNMIETNPKVPIYHLMLGDLYRNDEKYRDALEAYQNALNKVQNKGESQVAVLYFNMAICYENLDKNNSAKVKDLLEKAIQLDSTNPVYLNYLGYTLAEQGKDLQKALDVVKLALKQAPNDSNILDSLGWIYYKMKDYEKALPIMEKAVEKEPGNAIINEHLGDIYWRVGRLKDARFQWAHARTLKEYATDGLRRRIDEKMEKGLSKEK